MTATPPPASPLPAESITWLRHIRVDLALHTLRGGTGRPLLLLHGLGECTPTEVPAAAADWPGPVLGLDFTGHGRSSVPLGGGYTAEALMADVDAVLAAIGPVTVLGRGLGAYVALLIAGARPTLVTGAVLADGPGLDGGGPAPHSPSIIAPAIGPSTPPVPDPYALAELARDVRPADYAATFARQALEFSGLDAPLTVAAVVRPPWLAEISSLPGVVEATVADALATYATLTRPDRPD